MQKLQADDMAKVSIARGERQIGLQRMAAIQMSFCGMGVPAWASCAEMRP